MPRTMLVLRYAFFAAVATVANVCTQIVAYEIAPLAKLTISLVAGTVVGFLIKYILDKQWIFFDKRSSNWRETRKITLYGIFGLAMTFVFWGTELMFIALWQTNTAKYSGAVLGLAIGYAAKYLLDRRYVFAAESR